MSELSLSPTRLQAPTCSLCDREHDGECQAPEPLPERLPKGTIVTAAHWGTKTVDRSSVPIGLATWMVRCADRAYSVSADQVNWLSYYRALKAERDEQQVKVDMENCSRMLEALNARQAPEALVGMAVPGGKVTGAQMYYYDPTKRRLEPALDARVPPGHGIAVVGPAGSGGSGLQRTEPAPEPKCAWCGARMHTATTSGTCGEGCRLRRDALEDRISAGGAYDCPEERAAIERRFERIFQESIDEGRRREDMSIAVMQLADDAKRRKPEAPEKPTGTASWPEQFSGAAWEE